jgi:hypothetical protein
LKHGDIEDTLAQLAIMAGAGNPLSFLANAIGMTGSKFSSLNVKRVYFGNWLYLLPAPHFNSLTCIVH